ncbi:MAG: SUMF1/EgtB/PvdO family nonheme iron enzyme [Proteobacteria bacterium]|nr:SUMF1/EgtB/PvdO family nonheme iron enzyme [Pseudomonadota bacterium]
MPKVFISYSWDSDPHKAWVKTLADRLIGSGVEVIIDQYDCTSGDNFLAFMEKSVAIAERVLLILTENFKDKADKRERGVGYEGQVISAELYEDGLSNKFIPVLRSGTPAASTPVYLKGRAGRDMRRDGDFEAELEQLLKDIYGHSDKPPLGQKPVFSGQAPARAQTPCPQLAMIREAIDNGLPFPQLDAKSLHAITSHPPSNLDEYRLARIAEWSQPRYALDRRFTRLTLLLDQGDEAREVRWQAQPKPYDDLRTVLEDTGGQLALVLLGPPGCGKSTLLRRLELDLGVDALRQPGADSPVSLFLPLSLYRPPEDGIPLPSPQAWLEQEWASKDPDGHLPKLGDLLNTGRLVLLLDAINEMPHGSEEDYHRLIARWRDWLAQMARTCPGVRAVLSCRSLDYSASLSTPSLSVPHVRIEGLNDGQVEEFLAQYDPDLGPKLWRQLKGTAQLDLFRSPFYLNLLLKQAKDDGQVPKGRAALFTGFVRQALVREVEYSRNPIFQAGDLLTAWDHKCIVQHNWKGFELPEGGPLFRVLSDFAHGLQLRRGAANEARVRVKRAEALTLLGERAESILEAGVALQIVDADGYEVLFVHQLFQEYFAARAVAARPDPAPAHTEWRSDWLQPSLDETLKTLADSDPLPTAPGTGWEETFILAAEMLPDEGGFLRDLASHNLPLTGRCASVAAIAEPLRDQIRQGLLARSRDRQADLRARIAAAQALGHLGDPRFQRRQGPYGDYVYPPLVAIPGGVYRIGSDGKRYADESPQTDIRLAGFGLGQFPVTNAEWRCFQEAGGYEEERWWETAQAQAWRRGEGTAEGPKQQVRENLQTLRDNPDRIQTLLTQQQITSQEAQAWQGLLERDEAGVETVLDQLFPSGRQTAPAFWNDPAFNGPAQPVVGVCWHEARAYCAWLSAQTGQCFRLPTEAEWEAAAAGPPRRAWLGLRATKTRGYPWGGAFDSRRCNSFETHVRATTPVGVFPDGDSPEGIADLSGNVWEWTASLYRGYPYRTDDGREEPAAGGRRVLRGGAFYGSPEYVRCASRSSDDPAARNLDAGFRIVVSPFL